MAQRGAGSRDRFELKLLIDMNLSPRWIEALAGAGIEARHWSTVGDGAASGREVFQWVRRHGFVLLTHDLDFSRILALAGGHSPSNACSVTPSSRSSSRLPEVRWGPLDSYGDQGEFLTSSRSRGEARPRSPERALPSRRRPAAAC